MSTPHLRQRRGANLRLKGFWRTSLACNADSDASFFSSLSLLPLSFTPPLPPSAHKGQQGPADRGRVFHFQLIALLLSDLKSRLTRNWINS